MNVEAQTKQHVRPPAEISLEEPSDELTEYSLLGQLDQARLMRARSEEPRLDDTALYGLAGDVVRAIQPVTAASSASMLITLLTTFGAQVGRGAHVMVGNEEHYPVLFSLIIGHSGSGKGVATRAVRPVLLAADDELNKFMRGRQFKGFQSGEAVIQATADLPLAPGGGIDQRLLVEETEFGRVLTVAQRQGSTLSDTVRSLWDGDSAETRSKGVAIVAQEPHVCLLGHVTPTELTHKMDLVAIANGFANRFVCVWNRPTKLMPKPVGMSGEEIERFAEEWAAAVASAAQMGCMQTTGEFDDLFASAFYVSKLRPSSGATLDSLLARAAPHTLRLAMIYALLDGSDVIDAAHFRAARALWEFCEESAVWTFGATLGSGDLDALFAAVAAAGPAGLSRTEVSKLFSNNRDREELNDLVSELVGRGLVQAETEQTGGRPRHVLRVCSQ